MKKVLVLINKISDHPTQDELDVLVQAETIEKALDELGYEITSGNSLILISETSLHSLNKILLTWSLTLLKQLIKRVN